MRLSHRFSRRQFGRREISRAVNVTFAIDTLESRRLLSGETVQNPIPPVLASTTSPSNNSITLNQYFNDATLPGTLATFNTSEGEIQVALTDAATPLTVANFLSYVDSGEYDDTIFHRSVDLNDNSGGSPSDNATIIQGGGYSIMNNSIGHIATNAPVNDEYTTELYGDVAGTLAMAKTSYADSATSEWYFNVSDNTELDTPTTDPNGVMTSYTVFGMVLSGSSVISTIAALPTTTVSSLDNVPVSGLTETDLQNGASVGADNLVYTYDITTEPGTSYTVSSDNPSLVKPTVTDGVLSFTYGSGFGTANVTVNATNLDGTSASTVVSVTVPNPATPTAGPTTAQFTAPYVVTGSTGSFSVLGSDTDSVSALNPGSVTITIPPANGTASVNVSNGFITYTPNAGYTGPDSLTYTVADEAGTVSSPTVVTLDAVPTSVKLTVNPGKVLVFDEPDGVVGHLSVTGGSAVVTFSSFQVTTKNKGAFIVATGAGTDITDVTVTNTKALASLTITSTGPISIGTVNATDELNRINAPTTTFTGNMSIGGVSQFTAAALNGATLNLGALPGGDFTNLSIPNVTNSDVNAQGNLGLVKSKQWIITDSQDHYLQAAFVNDLEVPGIFDEGLDLTYDRFGLANAHVGNPTGPWTINGELVKATLGTLGTNFSITDYSEINDLTITGDLDNDITAAAINELTVKGKTSGAVIETDGTFSPKYDEIARLSFTGAVTNTVIYSNGSIGTITAPSLTGSRVYAGVEISVAQSAALAASSTDIANNASIGSISLGNGKAAFSNSLISADIIDSLRLGKITSSNNGTPQGVSAHTIISVAGTLEPGGSIKAGRVQLKTAATLTAYETKAKLALGDFEINLF